LICLLAAASVPKLVVVVGRRHHDAVRDFSSRMSGRAAATDQSNRVLLKGLAKENFRRGVRQLNDEANSRSEPTSYLWSASCRSQA
jgi:hypothetical protein